MRRRLATIWSFFLGLVVAPTTTIGSQDTLEWHGYQMMTFEHRGQAAKIVFPKEAHPDKPWIWRARFWGHEPQAELALLEKGFHLVWIDVADLYGAPRAVEIFTEYYEYLRRVYHLHQRAVLEGFSRGGLIVYNWASQHPEKVACIYADAPVCDIKSWPGGQGSGKGSPKDWARCLEAYGLAASQVDTFRGIPLFTAAKVAEAGVPALHVCGAVDRVVPIQENTYALEKTYERMGGAIRVIVKEGVDHHPHSLIDPTPIVRFVLEHTTPDLITPDLRQEAMPSIQVRSTLHLCHKYFDQNEKARVAFLGGSITNMRGWRDSVMQHLQRKYSSTDFEFINAGIPSMGSTPGAFRFGRDVTSHGKVDLLLVEAAVNDATNDRSPKAQIRGMEGIIQQALRSNPEMGIILMYFADQDKMAQYNQGKIPVVISQHEKVAEWYQISSINLAKEINDRILNNEFTWRDDFKDLHPSPFGQGIYAKTIHWTLDSLMDNKEDRPRLRQNDLLDRFSYMNAGLVSIDQAQSLSGWQRVENWEPADALPTRPGFVKVPALVAKDPNASLTFHFEGNAVGIFVAAGADVGVLAYRIDHGPTRYIEQYTRWSGQLHLPWLYILDDELEPGTHELTLQTTELKHPRSLGHACRIFHFAVNKR